MSFGSDIAGGLATSMTAIAVLIFLAGGAFVGFIFFGLPWLWRLLKPWLHQITG
jgi:hypothetical protein